MIYFYDFKVNKLFFEQANQININVDPDFSFACTDNKNDSLFFPFLLVFPSWWI